MKLNIPFGDRKAEPELAILPAQIILIGDMERLKYLLLCLYRDLDPVIPDPDGMAVIFSIKMYPAPAYGRSMPR
jgi:hypothetical protein